MFSGEVLNIQRRWRASPKYCISRWLHPQHQRHLVASHERRRVIGRRDRIFKFRISAMRRMNNMRRGGVETQTTACLAAYAKRNSLFAESDAFGPALVFASRACAKKRPEFKFVIFALLF
jgi:hypothetical protein